MLEVFLSDREFDFDFFVFSNNEVKYTVRDYSMVDEQTKELYCSLNRGTIILNGLPITIDNISEEQIEYINNIVELYKEKYKTFKENYKPCFVNYTFGNDIVGMIENSTVIEVPDGFHFKEWAYIKGFEYLQNFLIECNNKNNKVIKVRKKLIGFFRK